MFFSKLALLLFASAEADPFALSMDEVDKIMPAHDDARLLESTNGARRCMGVYECKMFAAYLVDADPDLTRGTRSCIGDDSCSGAGHRGYTTFGNGSCNGSKACKRGGDKGNAVIGNGSCGGNNACEKAGYNNGNAVIGNGSCGGNNACENAGSNNGNAVIGNDSCIGTQACVSAGADERKPLCVGDSACVSAAVIGNDSCIGNLACYNLRNVVIGSGSCNSATVAGVCQCLEDGDVIANDSCNSFGPDQCCIDSATRSRQSKGKKQLTLFEPTLTDIITTYQEAVTFCASKGLTLASKSDYCSAGVPFGGIKSGDQWSPIADYPNGWLQVGENPDHTICETHHESVSYDPQWGLDSDKQPYEANYVLCKDEI